ncbi:MAG: 4-hydroxythreonine-4-phosphate dehydrogenase PdxA [Opitutaceae bacterium]
MSRAAPQSGRPIAFTCGDPAGVGPDIIESWLREHPGGAAGVAVVGPPRWLESLSAKGIRIGVSVPVGLEGYAAVPGKPDGEGALVAWAAIERAAEGCRKGEFGAVVTGPVSKARLADLGWPFPGHTEFFAARWGGEPTMAFCGGRLRIALLTWHIPLREVPGQLSLARFARTIAAAGVLARKDGIARPKIGVCGLNPHAGEGGLLGREEIEIVDPILDRLRADYPGLSRTEPADTLFARHAKGEFDVVVALYHDQGLAPLKLVDFDEAVNVTLGLAHVRTSPDHGTGYTLAGTGRASSKSFSNAVSWAGRLMRPGEDHGG